MKRNYVLMAITILILIIDILGCAARGMVLNSKTKELNISKESIAIMTLRLSNQYKKDFQPGIKKFENGYYVYSRDKENKKYFFGNIETYKTIEKEFNEYIFSMQLPPGKYYISKINGRAYSKLFSAMYSAPLFFNFDIESNEVVYLGRIEATVRYRKNDDELRAGTLYPNPATQELSGFYRGTFDIKIYDNYEIDIKNIKQKYPVIENYSIMKRVGYREYQSEISTTLER